MPLPSTIVGQEKMLKRVWEHLMDDGTGIMGLYGMGGVEKTTLLELIYIKFLEHPVDRVEVVIFVVMSRELRVEMIQDEIAEKLGFGGEEWSRKAKRKKALVLHTSLKTKKFVLLLDDIWTKVDLKEIGVPLPTRANGCKVVFTTRSKEVCGHMGVADPMEVNGLESNEVDTLASSSAAEFPGMEDHILPVLKYSYDSLKGEHVKSCFLYCALFPEDVSIEKEKLVDYWICEGFIDETQGLKKAKSQAYGIIDTLIHACLLTEEEECELYVRMHDVVREMALWIVSDFGKDKERCIVKAGA